MFIVQTTNRESNTPFWLHNTTWTFSKERASQFESDSAARSAISKSMQFTKPRLFAKRFTNPIILKKD